MVLVLGPPRGVWSSVLHVPESIPLIQLALDSCASGDTILVSPGHYHERLVVPDKTITLASQTLLAGDTSFVSQTILDGDSLGTLMTVNVGGLNRFVLNGFTLQRGFTSLQEHGGALHFADSAEVVLQNLHFTRNFSRFWGGVIWADGGGTPFTGPRRFVVKNITLSRNYSRNTSLELIRIYANYYAEIDGLICNDAPSSIVVIRSNGTLILHNIELNNGRFGGGAAISGVFYGNEIGSELVVEDIVIRNSIISYGKLIGVGALNNPNRCTVNRITFENNRQFGNRTESAKLLNIAMSGSGSISADSLVFRNNMGLVPNSCVGVIQGAGSFDHHEDLVQHVLVENCQLGDSSYVPWDGDNRPTMMTVEGCTLQHAVFRNNTIILGERSNPPEGGVYGANILRAENYFSDSVYYHDLMFDNNLVIDLDNNATLPLHVSNAGRCMQVFASGFQAYLIDSCAFVNNRQPNMAEERPNGGDDDGWDVGSILFIGRPEVLSPLNHPMEFRNLYFADNDDGGIESIGTPNLRFHNIRMDRVSRQALKLSTNSFTLDNVFINGCTPFAPIATRSEQMPLLLSCNEPSTVRNCTVINSTTPYVIMAGTTPNGQPQDPIVTVENCLFWNNQYDRFEALVPNDNFRPGRYNYCLLPEAMAYGEQNLVDVPPFFDPELGPPCLSVDSPCVDSGNPDAAFYDLEDPTHPGLALWPSLGSLRNDIGYTGGPRAALLDTTWAALPDWEPTFQPRAFTLGAPWPNPFNPVTQIPYNLLRPAHVRLAVHNLIGQEVAVLVDGVVAAGSHTARFGSQRLASGTYLVTLEAGGRQETRAITLLR